MRRREFITLIGGAAAWPIAARPQQSERMRKIGILMPLQESDAESRRRIAAFSQILQQIGWVDGQTITLEKRFSDGKPERLATLANELVHADVDVIVSQAAEPIEALR